MLNLFERPDMVEDKYYKLAVLHALIGGIATMVIFPLGIVATRVLRTLTKKWWFVHVLLQGVLGTGAVITAFIFGLILAGVGGSQEKGLGVSHRRIGIILFILVVVQTIVGLALKATAGKPLASKTPKIMGHPVQAWFHVVMGLSTVGVGMWATYTGFDVFHVKTGVPVPLGVYIFWGAISSAAVCLYLAGLTLLPKQFTQEKAELAALKAAEEAKAKEPTEKEKEVSLEKSAAEEDDEKPEAEAKKCAFEPLFEKLKNNQPMIDSKQNVGHWKSLLETLPTLPK